MELKAAESARSANSVPQATHLGINVPMHMPSGSVSDAEHDDTGTGVSPTGENQAQAQAAAGKTKVVLEVANVNDNTSGKTVTAALEDELGTHKPLIENVYILRIIKRIIIASCFLFGAIIFSNVSGFFFICHLICCIFNLLPLLPFCESRLFYWNKDFVLESDHESTSNDTNNNTTNTNTVSTDENGEIKNYDHGDNKPVTMDTGEIRIIDDETTNANTKTNTSTNTNAPAAGSDTNDINNINSSNQGKNLASGCQYCWGSDDCTGCEFWCYWVVFYDLVSWCAIVGMMIYGRSWIIGIFVAGAHQMISIICISDIKEENKNNVISFWWGQYTGFVTRYKYELNTDKNKYEWRDSCCTRCPKNFSSIHHPIGIFQRILICIFTIGYFIMGINVLIIA